MLPASTMLLALLGACSEPAASHGTPSPSGTTASIPTASRPATRSASQPRDYAAHVDALTARLPNSGFAIVVEPPFVVVAEGGAAIAKSWATSTVRWAVTKLMAEYFAVTPGPILDIWLFESDASYRRYCKEVFDDTPTTPYGYYSAAHRALIMNISTGGGTLVHEIVHPFVAANFPRCPSWFNEGLGSLYEQSSERDGRIIGLTNWRLRGLQDAILAKRVRPLAELMATSSSEFYGEGSGLHYAMARYLLFWLQEEGLLQNFWKEFVAEVSTDPTGLASFQKIAQIQDLPAFQKRWEEWVLELRFH